MSFNWHVWKNTLLPEVGKICLIFKLCSNVKTSRKRTTIRRGSPGYAPPSVKECQEDAGKEVVNVVIELDRLAAVSPEVVFWRDDYDNMVAELRQLKAGGKTLTVAQVRDYFTTSRKFALGFMEHMEAIGVTVRKADSRRLKNN